MRLHELKAPRGANTRRTRVGRGESSGLGKTSGKGGKGQTARTGKGKPRRGFEGGQTPMYRRMPKRGFTNIFAKKWAEINLDTLAKYYPTKADVTLAALQEAGLAPRNVDGLRVLGRGELKVGLSVTANHFSGSAKQKIEAAGGTANVKA
jgi:large subunit ribosomal protein L15